MRIILLISALTLAQAQAASSQAAPFTCWIRGPADKAGRAAECAGLNRGPNRGRDHQAVLQPPVSARPQDHGRAGPVRPAVGGSAPTKPPASTYLRSPARRSAPGSRGRTPCTRFLADPSGRSSSTAAFSAGVFPSDKDVRTGDVGAGTVTTESLGAPVETLTLKFAPAASNATELVVSGKRRGYGFPFRRASD